MSFIELVRTRRGSSSGVFTGDKVRVFFQKVGKGTHRNLVVYIGAILATKLGFKPGSRIKIRTHQANPSVIQVVLAPINEQLHISREELLSKIKTAKEDKQDIKLLGQQLEKIENLISLEIENTWKLYKATHSVNAPLKFSIAWHSVILDKTPDVVKFVQADIHNGGLRIALPGSGITDLTDYS